MEKHEIELFDKIWDYSNSGWWKVWPMGSQSLDINHNRKKNVKVFQPQLIVWLQEQKDAHSRNKKTHIQSINHVFSNKFLKIQLQNAYFQTKNLKVEKKKWYRNLLGVAAHGHQKQLLPAP